MPVTHPSQRVAYPYFVVALLLFVLQVLMGTTVWASERSPGAFRLRTRGDDRDPGAPLGELTCRSLVIATGAHDRQLPFPGWDLPGVMTAGAAQALVKGSGVAPGRRVVVAGTGPFLLAVAATLLRAGVRVVAVVEAADPRPAAMAGLLPDLARGWTKAGELGHYLALLARERVAYLLGHRVVRAHGGPDPAPGTTALTGVTIARTDHRGRPRTGTERDLACDVLATGLGFTAALDLPLQLGCPVIRGADGGLAVGVDRVQRTGVPGVLAAGETTGVGGAELALLEGLLAGAAAAGGLGFAPSVPAARLRHWQRRIGGLRRFAAGLHRAFPVPEGWPDGLEDATVVCRCEEVNVGQVRDAVHELGATDPRTVKLLTRAGMGWCQGRVCGFAVERLCPPGPTDQPPAARAAAGSARPLTVPVGLGALAATVGHSDASTATEEEPPR